VAQHAAVDPGDVEGPVEKRFHRSADGREMDRGTEDDAVGPLHLLDPVIDLVVLDAALVFVLEALAAGEAASDRLVADVNDLGLDPGLLQFVGHHPDGMEGIAVLVGTAVECYRLHIPPVDIM